jgi:orotidine-5'-phosphate decarboxylase
MDKPIIALDFSSQKEVETFLNQFNAEEVLFVKVGMELFYQEGPSIIKFIKSKGHQLFLDLKLHDIPNTVEGAMKGIARLGVDMVNVHAAGGSQMIKAAAKGLREGTPEGKAVPKLIAVTQLTSTSESVMQEEQLITVSLLESVVHYAVLAMNAGADGVVCSPLEAQAVAQATSPSFLRVTPGIRPAISDHQDQVRVTTPAIARSIGSTHIVVGRPITKADDPVKAYHQIQKEWNLTL